MDWPPIPQEARRADLVLVPGRFWQGSRDPLAEDRYAAGTSLDAACTFHSRAVEPSQGVERLRPEMHVAGCRS